jgi:hypothetical protein
MKFGEFYDGFQKWLDAGEKHLWSKIKVSRDMPNGHNLIKGTHSGERLVPNIAFKSPIEGETC